MDKHKAKALDTDCLCSRCIYRFQCFTQERIFSDPIYQGLFEVLMAQGKTKEEALEEVTRELKWKIAMPLPQPVNVPYVPYVYPTGTSWTVGDSSGNGQVQVNYTMHNGEEVSWNANKETLRVHR